MKLLVLTPLVVSGAAFSQSSNEEQCKAYVDASLPMIEMIASRDTPAPSESVEKSKVVVAAAKEFIGKDELCNAYQALLKKS